MKEKNRNSILFTLLERLNVEERKVLKEYFTMNRKEKCAVEANRAIKVPRKAQPNGKNK